MRFLSLLCLFALVCGCSSIPEQEEIRYPSITEAKKSPAQESAFLQPPQVQTPRKFDLQFAVATALQNNPEIKAAQYKWRATVEKYPQVISLPDPMLSYSYFLRNIETRVGPQNHRLSLAQKFPFPRKLYLQGEVVKEEAKIAHLAYERTIRDITAQVQKSFYELVYIEMAIATTKHNQQVLAHLLDIATTEHGKNQGPIADLMKAQTQLAQLQYDCIRLEELREVEIGQLNALLHRSPGEPLAIKDLSFPQVIPLSDFAKLYEHARTNRQEILAAKIGIDKAGHEIALAYSQYFPDISLGFTWIQTDKTLSGFNFNFDDDGQDAWTLDVGIELPVWLSKRNAKVREAKWNGEQARQIQENLENQLAAMMKKSYYQATNSQRLVELYRDRLLPEAQNSLQTAENWYRDGQGSLTGILEVQSVWLNFSLALARAHSDYAQNLVELARLCGGALPNRGEEK